jgi:hypothetical protein
VNKRIPQTHTSKANEPIFLSPSEFIGSMNGTMAITGDIVSPIDVVWEADQGCDQNHLL